MTSSMASNVSTTKTSPLLSRRGQHLQRGQQVEVEVGMEEEVEMEEVWRSAVSCCPDRKAAPPPARLCSQSVPPRDQTRNRFTKTTFTPASSSCFAFQKTNSSTQKYSNSDQRHFGVSSSSEGATHPATDSRVRDGKKMMFSVLLCMKPQKKAAPLEALLPHGCWRKHLCYIAALGEDGFRCEDGFGFSPNDSQRVPQSCSAALRSAPIISHSWKTEPKKI